MLVGEYCVSTLPALSDNPPPRRRPPPWLFRWLWPGALRLPGARWGTRGRAATRNSENTERTIRRSAGGFVLSPQGSGPHVWSFQSAGRSLCICVLTHRAAVGRRFRVSGCSRTPTARLTLTESRSRSRPTTALVVGVAGSVGADGTSPEGGVRGYSPSRLRTVLPGV